MKKIIKEIIADFHAVKIEGVIPREVVLPTNTNKIVTLIGPRRSGKSFCFYYTIQQLLEKGIKLDQILYLNFEDERLDLKAAHLDEILQAYRELYPDNKLNRCYFFFDEIQNVQGWEKFVRRIYDTVTKKIFLTGSNAKLLSFEIASALRGRTVTFELLTLSFAEYLRFHRIDFSKSDSTTKAKVNRMFDKYLSEGGFPEMLLQKDYFRKKILQEYFDVMIYRDLIERYNYTNVTAVKYVMKRLAANTCSYVSVLKIYNELRSQGIKADKNLLYHVFESAQNIYLTMPVLKFDYSLIKQSNADKKVYFVDNGLLNALTVKFSDNNGLLLENLVYLHYKRSAHAIFYYKNGKECDFIVEQVDGKILPVQVTWDMKEESTFRREVNGMVAACHYLKVKKGIIVTRNEERLIKSEGVSIQLVSVIDLILRKKIVSCNPF